MYSIKKIVKMLFRMHMLKRTVKTNTLEDLC